MVHNDVARCQSHAAVAHNHICSHTSEVTCQPAGVGGVSRYYWVCREGCLITGSVSGYPGSRHLLFLIINLSHRAKVGYAVYGQANDASETDWTLCWLICHDRSE